MLAYEFNFVMERKLRRKNNNESNVADPQNGLNLNNIVIRG